MFRIGLMALTILAGTTSAVPLPRGLDGPIPRLEDTAWVGQGPDFRTVYRFEKGGTLSYTYLPNNNTFRNGTWKQEGPKVYFEANNKYFEFHGVIRNKAIDGEGKNTKGGKWTIHLELEAASKR